MKSNQPLNVMILICKDRRVNVEIFHSHSTFYTTTDFWFFCGPLLESLCYRNVGSSKLKLLRIEFMHLGNDSTFLRLIASQERKQLLLLMKERRKGRKKEKAKSCLTENNTWSSQRKIIYARFTKNLSISNPRERTLCS